MARTRGFESLADNLQRLSRAERRAFYNKQFEYVQSVKDRIVAKAPRKSGRLRRYIFTKEINTARKIALRIAVPSKPAFYGRFQEFGTKRGIVAKKYFFQTWRRYVTSSAGVRLMQFLMRQAIRNKFKSTTTVD